MVPKRRLAVDPEAVEKVEAALAVVLPFPARKDQPAKSGGSDGAGTPAARLASSPSHGERPTLLTPRAREWLKVALISSVLLHGAAFVIFELRFEDDLERAAGAAAALSSDGTITIPIEVVVESTLPSAPSSTDATAAEAEKPSEAPPVEEVKEEKQPELTEKEIQALVPLPPDPVPLEFPKPPVQAEVKEQAPEAMPDTVPAAEEAQQVALPEEETAPPIPAETSNVSEAPPATTTLEENPPLPLPREPVREAKKEELDKPKAEQPREKQNSTRSRPSRAASPSRAAAANSAGSAGAGGSVDNGGRAATSSYQAQVLAHLSRFQFYPPEARSRGETGVARVKFALGRNGQVLSVSLAGGSGVSALDEAAIAIVRRASPFPPFPSALTQARMQFGAPIRFTLR